MAVNIKRETIRLRNGDEAILNTTEIYPGTYETMLSSPDYGREYVVFKSTSKEQALLDFRRIKRRYNVAPLTGKYLQLSEDLKCAAIVAKEVAEGSDDDGTCNFDAAVLYLKGWNEEKVKQAANAAGVGCSTWTMFRTKHYVFSPSVRAQANARTKAAEAMMNVLAEKGYDASMYYQMD